MSIAIASKLPGFLGRQHRRLALLDDVLGAADRRAGFKGMTWPMTSQSKSIRMAARCCLTVGAGFGLRELLDVGGDVHRLDVDQGQTLPLAPSEEIARPPGRRPRRVFGLRMVAVKNSMKRRAAWSPASAMRAGRIGPEVVPVMPRER